jgi:ATP-dependent Clp protease ATP-binding subunit ClpA
MSEYQEKHTVSRLIGSPPGYVGYEEGGLLTDAIRKTPNAVVLLDEIEKAHPDIYNILLQIMDYATLTDNQGRKADFRNVILIMTSNAGARDIGKPLIGFGDQQVSASALDEAVERAFSPEFRNRLDAVVHFNNLPMEVIERIVKKAIDEFGAQLAEKNVTLKAETRSFGSSPARYSREFGARNIARLVEDQIKTYSSMRALRRLEHGGTALARLENDKIVFDITPRDAKAWSCTNAMVDHARVPRRVGRVSLPAGDKCHAEWHCRLRGKPLSRRTVVRLPARHFPLAFYTRAAAMVQSESPIRHFSGVFVYYRICA